MRDKAAKALILMGIPMNQSGFLYIVDIMELYEEHGAPMTNMGAVYRKVAISRKRNPDDIKNEISRSIQYAFNSGSTSERIKYFGLGITPKSNGNYLAMMWQRLKEEE